MVATKKRRLSRTSRAAAKVLPTAKRTSTSAEDIPTAP